MRGGKWGGGGLSSYPGDYCEGYRGTLGPGNRIEGLREAVQEIREELEELRVEAETAQLVPESECMKALKYIAATLGRRVAALAVQEQK